MDGRQRNKRKKQKSLMMMIKAWQATILSAAYLGLATASQVMGLSTPRWGSGGSRFLSHAVIS
jgi:hypothetical protein